MTQKGFTWHVIDIVFNHGLGLERDSSHNLTNNSKQFFKKVFNRVYPIQALRFIRLWVLIAGTKSRLNIEDRGMK